MNRHAKSFKNKEVIQRDLYKSIKIKHTLFKLIKVILLSSLGIEW